MQEYVCDKGHRFLFPIKIINYNYGIPQMTPEEKAQLNGLGFKGVSSMNFLQGTMEYNACPFCESFNRSISVAPEENIVSVKSVPLEEVDSWLAQGYKIRELYAKTATLIKTASANPELATHDPSITDVNDQ